MIRAHGRKGKRVNLLIVACCSLLLLQVISPPSPGGTLVLSASSVACAAIRAPMEADQQLLGREDGVWLPPAKREDEKRRRSRHESESRDEELTGFIHELQSRLRLTKEFFTRY